MTYSIITINFNNKDGLAKTIESVVSQTCQDYEFIVIDGGSTDGSVDVIKNYQDKIAYWVSEPDKGVYNAMNKGILKAQGEYLNFMNSGDFFFDSNVLGNIKGYLTHDIVEGDTYNRSTKSYSAKPVSHPTMMFFYGASLDHQSCFIRKALFANSLYDESLKIVSDWKFFMQKIVFEDCSYRHVPVTVASFEGNGTTAQNPQLNRKEREETLRALFPPKILSDFERFYDKESPIIDLIPQLNRTVGLQNLICKLIKAMLRIYNCLHK